MAPGDWHLAARFRLTTSFSRHFWMHKNGLDHLILMESLISIVSVDENILYLSD
jgi:hypothetical protein